MSKKEKTSKEPLDNEERPTLKIGIYKCCGPKEWKRFVIKKGQKNQCNRCNKTVKPITRITWNKRWYGHFKCTEKSCKNVWSSSNTWTVNNKIQTTQCKKCLTSVLPFEIVSNY